MGRAIVRHPKVFLFDEPLSNLDAKLRTQMRAEIKRLHNRLGVTSIYVTHDQVEAMTLADRIVVMNDGRIEQVGTPMELFNNPANIFVAGFLGSPPMNQIKGRLTETGARVGDTDITLAGATNGHAGRDVIVGIRPEHVTVGAEASGQRFTVTAEVVDPLGSDTLVMTRLGGNRFWLRISGQSTVQAGDTLDIGISAGMSSLFDGADERRL